MNPKVVGTPVLANTVYKIAMGVVCHTIRKPEQTSVRQVTQQFNAAYVTIPRCYTAKHGNREHHWHEGRNNMACLSVVDA